VRSILRLGFVSSFIPKKCGIATFSRDLMNGISDNFPSNQMVVAAAENDNESYIYPESVIAILKTNDLDSYRRRLQNLIS